MPTPAEPFRLTSSPQTLCRAPVPSETRVFKNDSRYLFLFFLLILFSPSVREERSPLPLPSWAHLRPGRISLPRLLDYCSSIACQPPSTRWIDAIASKFHVPSSKTASRLFLPSAVVSESGSNKLAKADLARLAAPTPETTLPSSTPILPRVGLLRIVLFVGDFRFFPFDRGIAHPLCSLHYKDMNSIK